jgi:predicted DNA-binding transcriptional regulator AlpA
MDLNFYTAQQVSAKTGMSVDWIWRQARMGRIPHHKLGGRYRWTDDDLAVLATQSAVAPKVTRNQT